MKIGIITFNSAHNYGAVLQVWALQEKLKCKGHKVEVINYRIPSIDNLYRVYVPKRICKVSWVNKGIHQLQWIHAWMNDRYKAVRYKKFEYFINHVLPTTKPYYSYDELLKANMNYDILITGSDQVWNGKYTRGLSAAYFLSFGKEETKRISYAASIGKDSFEEEEKLVAKRYLADLDYISVREEKARKAVEKLTDKPVELVLDPTLLLDRQAYDKIKKKTNFKGDYIFVHNVHLTRIDSRLNAIVEKISEMTGLPVVNNRSDYNFKNEIGKFNDGGPGEFIGVIEGAKYIITNSFHATVFSIIYRRNFITVPHFQNPDRMKYLLQMFDLQNHLIENVAKVPNDLKTLQIDYARVEKLKMKARMVSETYLENSINGEKTVKQEIPQGVHIKQTYLLNAIKSGRAYVDDKKILDICSGGAVAYAIADKVWKEGGIVVGTSYDERQMPMYQIAEKPADANDFFKVKYTGGRPEKIFGQIKQSLSDGRKVLFMGSPREIVAVYDYLKEDYSNFYTLEWRGNGTIMREIYDSYLRSLENLFHSKIKKLDWDNKTKSADTPFVCVEFENEETWVCSEKANMLLRAMRRGMVQEYECYFDKLLIEHKTEADFSIDARGRSEDMHKDGEEILFINTNKGMELFEKIDLPVIFKEGKIPFAEERLTLKVERNIFIREIQNGEDTIGVLKRMLAKKVVF